VPERYTMKFSFVCPESGELFESANFKVVDNRGVKLDEFGHKVLDARVEMMGPCPRCGKQHTYHARELMCPFEAKQS
jgi:Fe2+ or Zn2+ uptake regulation protein